MRNPVPNKLSTSVLLLIQAVIVIGILIARLLLNYVDSDSAPTIVRLSCMCLPLLFFWILYSWKKSGSELFSPYTLLAFSIFIFNAGQACLEDLGLNRKGLLNGLVSTDILAQTLLLVLYALSVMHFGALIARVGKAHSKPRMLFDIPAIALRRVAIVLFAIAVIPSLVIAQHSLSMVSSGGYMSLYQVESSTGIRNAPAILAGYLMPAGFLLLAGSGRNRLIRVFASGLVASYILLQLFIGFRGNAILVLAAFLWLWHRAIRRFNLGVPVIVLAVIGVFVLPAVGSMRNYASSERASISKWVDAITSIDNPAVAIVSEMGESMITPAYTIRLVPENHNYEYGASYAYAAFALVPNLFWDVHPAVAHSPSAWLVNTVAPASARAGGGLGYSAIAEAYLNFGFVGAGVPMGLLGWWVGRLSRWTEVNSAPWKLCLVAIMLIPLLLCARADSQSLVRNIAWYVGIPYILLNRWPKTIRPEQRLARAQNLAIYPSTVINRQD